MNRLLTAVAIAVCIGAVPALAQKQAPHHPEHHHWDHHHWDHHLDAYYWDRRHHRWDYHHWDYHQHGTGDYDIIRWSNGECKIWHDDGGAPRGAEGTDWLLVGYSIPSYGDAWDGLRHFQAENWCR